MKQKQEMIKVTQNIIKKIVDIEEELREIELYLKKKCN